jgi:hypothetical protein
VACRDKRSGVLGIKRGVRGKCEISLRGWSGDKIYGSSYSKRN